MSDEILRSGDKAIYQSSFTPALVAVQPGILTGSGQQIKAQGAPVCVQGDEASATISGCSYISGGFTIPGVGTLSIAKLGRDQLSQKCKAGGKVVLLCGTTFTAQFQVTLPAQMPTPVGPVPDPMPLYRGSGSFKTTNKKVRDKG